MPAVCLTRPQYVLRSYCDSGSSRLPGREADIVAWVLGAAFVSLFTSPLCFVMVATAGFYRAAKWEEEKGGALGVTDSISWTIETPAPLEAVIRQCLSGCTTCGMCRRCEAFWLARAVAKRASRRPGGGFQSWIFVSPSYRRARPHLPG